jgi:hypothetical protein
MHTSFGTPWPEQTSTGILDDKKVESNGGHINRLSEKQIRRIELRHEILGTAWGTSLV